MHIEFQNILVFGILKQPSFFYLGRVMSQKSDRNNPSDPRPEGLVDIGWINIAMLGVYIPLSAVLSTASPLAAIGSPLLIVAGAIGAGYFCRAKAANTILRTRLK